MMQPLVQNWLNNWVDEETWLKQIEIKWKLEMGSKKVRRQALFTTKMFEHISFSSQLFQQLELIFKGLWLYNLTRSPNLGRWPITGWTVHSAVSELWSKHRLVIYNFPYTSLAQWDQWVLQMYYVSHFKCYIIK